MSEPTQQFPQQPYGGPPYGPAQIDPPAAPGPAPRKPRQFGWIALLIAAVSGLCFGFVTGELSSSPSAGGKATTTATPAPAPTVTVTETAAAPTLDPVETLDPTEAPTTEPPETTFSPKKADFVIGIKTLSKQCFGSAGCNVTFRIAPAYIGSASLPSSGETEVTYRVTGLEDPVENTFTIDGEGTASFQKEEIGQTTSSSAKLAVKVLAASYTP